MQQHPENQSTTAPERIAEIGEILALGLMRLLARKSSENSAGSREVSLDCVGGKSGDANSEMERIGR